MSLLGELVAQLLGDAAIDAFEEDKQPDSPLPERGFNGSLGALASFGGTLAFILGLAAFSVLLDERSVEDVGSAPLLAMVAASLFVSWYARRAGLRAPLVTQRHLCLAAYGAKVSVAGLWISALASVMWTARLIEWGWKAVR